MNYFFVKENSKLRLHYRSTWIPQILTILILVLKSHTPYKQQVGSSRQMVVGTHTSPKHKSNLRQCCNIIKRSKFNLDKFEMWSYTLTFIHKGNSREQELGNCAVHDVSLDQFLELVGTSFHRLMFLAEMRSPSLLNIENAEEECYK